MLRPQLSLFASSHCALRSPFVFSFVCRAEVIRGAAVHLRGFWLESVQGQRSCMWSQRREGGPEHCIIPAHVPSIKAAGARFASLCLAALCSVLLCAALIMHCWGSSQQQGGKKKKLDGSLAYMCDTNLNQNQTILTLET